MTKNAKSQLQEFLQALGYETTHATFQTENLANGWESTVTVSFFCNRVVQGTGQGQRKTEAEIAASQNAIHRIYNDHPELAKLVSNWEEIQVEAQQGDALIKLAMYLTPAFKTANDKTKKLQDIEKNSDLAEVFEHWKAQGNSDLALWGNNLNQHKKATLVEALLWRRFGNKILTDNAFESLQALLEILQ